MCYVLSFEERKNLNYEDIYDYFKDVKNINDKDVKEMCKFILEKKCLITYDL